MEDVGMALTVLGFGLGMLSLLFIVVPMAEDKGIMRAAFSFVVPVLALIYGLFHWRELKVAVVANLIGCALLISGEMLR